MRYWPHFITACRRRYGTAFTLRVSFGGTMVYLANPADITEVFAGDPRIYHAGDANSMRKGMLGDSPVLVVDDDVHAEQRRMMVAPFKRQAVARQSAGVRGAHTGPPGRRATTLTPSDALLTTRVFRLSS